MKKTVLILVDGMRPDSLEACGHKFISEMYKHSHYTLGATTVMPSVTLPCHMSLFHSVSPQRHGILSNTYVPQVRPIRGLCEILHASRKVNSFFYNWEELKDLSRPDSLSYAVYASGNTYGYLKSNRRLTDSAIEYINADSPDFTFLYLGDTDIVGHTDGWMSKEYLESVSNSFDCIEKVVKSIPDDYVIMVTADHGGHDRSHGADVPEDMLIPLIIYNKDYNSVHLDDVNIIDIAPTITKLMDIESDSDWEGKAISL